MQSGFILILLILECLNYHNTKQLKSVKCEICDCYTTCVTSCTAQRMQNCLVNSTRLSCVLGENGCELKEMIKLIVK